MNTLKKAFSLLTRRERRSGALMLVLSTLKAVGDMIGVASIVPFLSLVGNPGFIQTNKYAAAVYEYFGFSSAQRFVLAMGAVVIGVLVANSALRSLAAYALNRWVAMRGHSLAVRLLESYLRQPYVYFLDRHSADLSTHLLSETQRVVSSVYRPFADLLSASLTFIFVVGLLLWTKPAVTLFSVIVLGGSYVLLFYLLRSRLIGLAGATLNSNLMRFRLTWEALAGVKQIQLLNRERDYLNAFSRPSLEFARVTSTANTLRQVPNYALEALAFGGIIFLTMLLVSQGEGSDGTAIGHVLPVLGLFAFAGYKLLPTLQIIYSSLTTLRIGGPAVDAVFDGINGLSDLPPLPAEQPRALGLKQKLEFRNVSFRYPGAEASSLEDISFEAPKGANVGIVGPTGSGKSTLTDLLLGLLEPQSGQVVVDDVPLDRANIRRWRAGVGYVPQQIFLADCDVAQNIALGVPPEDISQAEIHDAARSAQIRDFVLQELPHGFQTFIGEGGVRLSGGQRQRLGIARALYTDPDVIVFDEATSALDNLTEKELMQEIGALSGQKTVIMVAHRLSTVRNCDLILVLRKGRIVGAGSYDELEATNAQFRQISQAART